MKTPSRIKMAATVASVVRASSRPGAPGLAQRAQAVPRLVRSTLDGTYAGTTVRRLGLVGAAVAYVVSPVDLLPEAVLPVLGAADDAVVITWAIKVLLEETDRFLAWEARDVPVRAGGVSDGMRRDRDTTGAAAPGRVAGSRTDPGRSERVSLPEGVRQAATDYVLESVRKRLER
ncbi:YkvA family protein [Terrabacter sp. 2RAF25]|uniref:YkvA family protein n=1 Tax=Terrabacter sp. 2RAF25 TaxID=3232998 RepID=UPI003F96CC08